MYLCFIGGAQRCSICMTFQHHWCMLVGLGEEHTLMARGHTVCSVDLRITRCTEVRGVGAAVHHAWHRATSVAQPGPAPFSSNRLLINGAVGNTIHEQGGLVTCTTKTMQGVFVKVVATVSLHILCICLLLLLYLSWLFRMCSCTAYVSMEECQECRTSSPEYTNSRVSVG